MIGQNPAGGAFVARGSTVTLIVSKGPKTAGVPEVTTLEREIAIATLRDAGFRARVVLEDTDDPSFHNIVLRQDPEPGTQVKPGSTVTITVGRAVETTTETEPPGE